MRPISEYRMPAPVHWRRLLGTLACALGIAAPTWPADLQQSLEVVSATNRESAQSQQKIDQLARETEELLEEYRRLRNSNDYQAAYTSELQLRNEAQLQRIAELQAQIRQVNLTQQRILPLLRSMADALERFVVLDLPFHQQERINGVLQLKQKLRQPGISMAGKFRLVLEAWQLEQDFSNGIEAYRGTLSLDGETRSVEFLRIGRMALYFRALDGANGGTWDRDTQAWVALSPADNRALERALRVARKQVAPELLPLPLPVPGKAS